MRVETVDRKVEPGPEGEGGGGGGGGGFGFEPDVGLGGAWEGGGALLGRASTASIPGELCACGPRFPRGGYPFEAKKGVLGAGGGFGGGCLFSQPIHLRPEASADFV